MDMVIGTGPGARTVAMDIKPFTCVAASSKLKGLPTGKFGLVFALSEYTLEEMTLIVQRSTKMQGLTVDDAAASEIARRANGTPGEVSGLLRRVRDYADVRSGGMITTATVANALDLMSDASPKRSPVKVVNTPLTLPHVDETGLEPINELLGLTGLDAVKREVVSLANFIRITRLRSQSGLAVSPLSPSPCVYRQSRHRQDHRCSTTCQNLPGTWCFSEGAPRRSGSVRPCGWLFGTDCDQDWRSDTTGFGRDLVHRRSVFSYSCQGRPVRTRGD